MFAASQMMEGAKMAGFVWMTFSFSTAKVAREDNSGCGGQGESTQGCRLSQKACPGSVPPAGDRGEEKAALLRPRLKAVSLKAFFLSSEGTGPNHGSSPCNLVLCRAVKSLCLEKCVRKVHVC